MRGELATVQFCPECLTQALMFFRFVKSQTRDFEDLGPRPHCHRSLQGCQRTHMHLAHLLRTQALVHDRESTGWSHHRFFDASWERSRRSLCYKSVPETVTRRNPRGVLSNMPNGSMRFQSLSFVHLPSLITHAQGPLGSRKTYSRKAAFENGGHSHACQWWQSVQCRKSFLRFHINTFGKGDFRFVRIPQKTAIAHQEEVQCGRSNVSRPRLDAIHRWICAQNTISVFQRREGRGQHTT